MQIAALHDATQCFFFAPMAPSMSSADDQRHRSLPIAYGETFALANDGNAIMTMRFPGSGSTYPVAFATARRVFDVILTPESDRFWHSLDRSKIQSGTGVGDTDMRPLGYAASTQTAAVINRAGTRLYTADSSMGGVLRPYDITAPASGAGAPSSRERSGSRSSRLRRNQESPPPGGLSLLALRVCSDVPTDER